MQFIDEIKADVVYFKYTKFSAWSSTDRKGENGKMINASNTNLFNRYSNLACNSYYGIPIEPENLFEQGHEQDHCEAFIRTHFEKGCKSEALNFEETWEKHYRTEGKHIHTVSLYILGLYVQEIIRDELESKMKEIIGDGARLWYEFRYTWFLTCLFHDAASCIEMGWEEGNQGDLQSAIRMLGIQKTPYTYRPIKKDVRLTRYDEETIKSYFKYLKGERGRLHTEHGIIAGYKLFDSLYRNFCRVTEGKQFVAGVYIEKETGLHWRKSHLDHFAYISDAIICHNLWTVTDGNNSKDKKEVKKYRENGLGDLIIPAGSNENDKKLSLSAYPLQFMLCLLDTIEPVKRFTNGKNGRRVLTPKETLKSIDMKYNSWKCVLAITWDEALRECSDNFKDWEKQINDLPKWMDVKLTEPERNCIEIQLPSQGHPKSATVV